MTKKQKFLKILRDYGITTIGCVLYGLGVSMFLTPYQITPGGVTGISQTICYLLNWEAGIGLLMLAINIPLFIVGAIVFGKKFLLSTFYATFLSSGFVELFDWLFQDIRVIPVENPLAPLIAAVVGAILFGAGAALIFRVGSSTGGTDIVVKLLRRKFRHLLTGEICLMIDATIVIISAIVHQDFLQGFYSALCVATFMLVFDQVLYGGNSAKLVYIVPNTHNVNDLCQKLMLEVDTGATFLQGKGAYSGEDKQIIMCVCKNISYPKLRDVVRREDPQAFIIVSSAREIYGLGYKDQNADEL